MRRKKKFQTDGPATEKACGTEPPSRKLTTENRRVAGRRCCLNAHTPALTDHRRCLCALLSQWAMLVATLSRTSSSVRPWPLNHYCGGPCLVSRLLVFYWSPIGSCCNQQAVAVTSAFEYTSSSWNSEHPAVDPLKVNLIRQTSYRVNDWNTALMKTEKIP